MSIEPTELALGETANITYTFVGVDTDGDFVERDYRFDDCDYPRKRHLKAIMKDAKRYRWTLVSVRVKCITYAVVLVD